MGPGTAHTFFAGYRLILPAHTLSERQLLKEHVSASLHHKHQVRVDTGRDAWLIEQVDQAHSIVFCGLCDLPINAECHELIGPAAFCVACALR